MGDNEAITSILGKRILEWRLNQEPSVFNGLPGHDEDVVLNKSLTLIANDGTAITVRPYMNDNDETFIEVTSGN